jgi:uncharacterized membrane protein YeaQ/YmgE (transglycosylase-associated protein family)
MHILAWLIAGLIAGFIASKIVNKTGEGVLLDIVLGIAGGILGGWLTSVFGYHVESGLNIPSIIVAAIGGVVILVVYHVLRRTAYI